MEPFESIWDFTERVDPQVVNKRALESLVKCGALDSIGASRKGACSRCSTRAARARLSSDTPTALAGQSSIFDTGDEQRRRWSETPVDLDRRVRQGRASAAREGDARPLRVRAPTRRRPRPAAPTRRPPARRARATSRRRGRDGRRNRLDAQAADDEEGRSDGVRPTRRPHREAPRSSSSTPSTRHRGSSSRPTASSSSRAVSTTSRRVRRS